MFTIARRRSQKAGLPPGTLMHIGERSAEPVKLEVVHSIRDEIRAFDVGSVSECIPLLQENALTWVNVTGVHDASIIGDFGIACGIHPLVLEDIMNTTQRPKFEDYDNHIFVVLKIIDDVGAEGSSSVEQVSLILGPRYVLTFQERSSNVFSGVKERLLRGKGRMRQQGSDYLAYALIDAAVDNYFGILETMGEKLEELDEAVLAEPTQETAEDLQRTKREMLLLRKSIWPLREVISALQRGESPLVHDTTQIYFRDTYDHTIQVIETLETMRDMLSGMLDIYLSSVSNRMNEIMKTITIIATIFIPVTFIAGLYGMNFEHMPELQWRYGYFFVLAIMASTVGGMVLYLKRRKWL
jgi:magnesium transporter